MMAAGKNATTCSDVPDPKCEYAKVTLGYQADEAWVVIIAVLIWVSMTCIMCLLAFQKSATTRTPAESREEVKTSDQGVREQQNPLGGNTAATFRKCHYGDSHGFVL